MHEPEGSRSCVQPLFSVGSLVKYSGKRFWKENIYIILIFTDHHVDTAFAFLLFPLNPFFRR